MRVPAPSLHLSTHITPNANQQPCTDRPLWRFGRDGKSEWHGGTFPTIAWKGNESSHTAQKSGDIC